MYRIKWQTKAVRQLRKIPENAEQRIRAAVNTLVEPEKATNVKRLRSHDYDYRLRVGNYRVFFDVEKTVEIVWIEEVKKRDERTY
jgi:mRNA interferase RelE/StbE